MLPTIPICANEPGRLDALRSTGLLDTPAEAAFDGITWLAKTQLSAPMSAISLVDRDRQWFKSRQNLDIVETPRDVSFCTHALVTEHPFIVMDTSRDTRFAHSPMVVGPPQVRFYLGMPLITKERFALGALCVYDTTPRAAVTPDQLNAMSILARLATDSIELRRIAESDGLTNLMTRSAFRRGATAELSRCKRHQMNAACLVADIDEFKRINDTLGQCRRRLRPAHCGSDVAA
jgi:GAF domain-containing protein